MFQDVSVTFFSDFHELFGLLQPDAEALCWKISGTKEEVWQDFGTSKLRQMQGEETWLPRWCGDESGWIILILRYSLEILWPLALRKILEIQPMPGALCEWSSVWSPAKEWNSSAGEKLNPGVGTWGYLGQNDMSFSSAHIPCKRYDPLVSCCFSIYIHYLYTGISIYIYIIYIYTLYIYIYIIYTLYIHNIYTLYIHYIYIIYTLYIYIIYTLYIHYIYIIYIYIHRSVCTIMYCNIYIYT